MSTKIYNGYISNLSLTDLLFKFKEIEKQFKTHIHENFYKSLIDAFVFNCDVLKKEITYSNLVEYYEKCEEHLKEVPEYESVMHDVDLDLKTECCVFPLSKNRTLILFYTDNNASTKFWEELDYIHDYHYQNQTDRPENITKRAWDTRIKNWDKVLGGNGYGRPIDCGYTYTFHDRKIPFRFSLRKWVDFMLENVPSDAERKKRILRDKLFNEIINTLSEEERRERVFSTYHNFAVEFREKYNNGEYGNELNNIELEDINILLT